jgi:hypothetical protein
VTRNALARPFAPSTQRAGRCTTETSKSQMPLGNIDR